MAGGAMKLSHMAAELGLERRGGDVTVTAVHPLAEAGPESLSFLAEKKYRPQAARAAALVVTPELAEGLTVPCLLSQAPALDLARAARLLGYPELSLRGIHPTAVVDPSATIGVDVALGPGVVIGPGAAVGDRSVLHAGVVILDRCVVGADCTIHANSVIGAEGFGYEPVNGRLERIPHFGIVRIEDDVEIGACTTIDRARFGETRIGSGCRIDNLVQIGHNVQIGRSCILVGQVGVAGSVTVEDGAILAGQAGVVPHVTIGRGARVAAGTGVAGDVPAGTTWSGWWGQPHRQSMVELSSLRKLPEFMKQVRAFMKKHGE